MSHAVQFLSKLCPLDAVAAVTGFANVSPPLVERLTKTLGTEPSERSGMEETSQTLCLAS